MKQWLDYYTGLTEIKGNAKFNEWCQQLPAQITESLALKKHGRLPIWAEALEALPDLPASHITHDAAAVSVSADIALAATEQQQLVESLKTFMPWRKGPYNLHGVAIDSEWRSDLKWDRLADKITPLKNRLVLDVGSGNGYHCWRMAAMQAKAVMGIDPYLLYIMQYFAVQHFMRSPNVFVLPMGLEAMPAQMRAFDTVFSMGVLYHRRSPIDHLFELRDCLRAGGELILETLVVDGAAGYALMPSDRYARMKNVWFIPSCATLEQWLARCGFVDVQQLDISVTDSVEQRVSPWAGGESLRDFLDPQDPSKTIEGYPSPKRVIYIARTAG